MVSVTCIGSPTCKSDPNPNTSILKSEQADDIESVPSTPIAWHPVTKRMSKTNYKDPDCIKPIQIETVRSVKSFFVPAEKGKQTMNQSSKMITAKRNSHIGTSSPV